MWRWLIVLFVILSMVNFTTSDVRIEGGYKIYETCYTIECPSEYNRDFKCKACQEEIISSYRSNNIIYNEI
jgi:hypothetical protein